MPTIGLVFAIAFGFIVGYLTSDVIRKFMAAYKDKEVKKDATDTTS